MNVTNFDTSILYKELNLEKRNCVTKKYFIPRSCMTKGLLVFADGTIIRCPTILPQMPNCQHEPSSIQTTAFLKWIVHLHRNYLLKKFSVWFIDYCTRWYYQKDRMMSFRYNNTISYHMRFYTKLGWKKYFLNLTVVGNHSYI